MLIDLHIHEKKYSKDSNIFIPDIIEEAKRKGLDGICITNHDDLSILNDIEYLSKGYDFPIFIGVEYLTMDGDIVAFGIDKLPDYHLTAQEFINLVKSKGGVCISAHPYRNNNRGLGDKIKTLEGLNAVEAFNGNTDFESNIRAFKLADELGLKKVGASDAHHIHEVGKFATYFPGRINNTLELINAIKLNDCFPAIYEDSGYRIIK